MNIYVFEFKQNLKSTVIWSLSVSALILMFMSVYQGFAADTEILNELLLSYPEEFLRAFGMSREVNIASVLGFVSMLFTFVQICLAVQAANYGFSLVSVEERELTADFLLPKPVNRTSILTSKLFAAVTCLIITNLVVWISTFTFINIFKGERDYDVKTLILLLSTIIFLQLFFLCVSMLISLFFKKIKSVLTFSMGLVFGLYIISAFGEVIGDANFGYITPFKHFEANYIVSNSSYNTSMFLIDIFIILISIILSYILYKKRNIQSI